MQTLGIDGSINSNASSRWSLAKQKLNIVTATNHAVRKVDYVLVYQKKKNETKKQRSKTRKLQYFLRELRKEGLKIEYANLAYMKIMPHEDDDEDVAQALDRKYVQFIKVEATIDFLMKYAEILNINMPLRPDLVNVINDIKRIKMEKYVIKNDEDDDPADNRVDDEDSDEDDEGEEIEDFETGSCFQGIKELLKPTDFKIAEEMDYFSAIFRKDKLDFFDIYSEGNTEYHIGIRSSIELWGHLYCKTAPLMSRLV